MRDRSRVRIFVDHAALRRDRISLDRPVTRNLAHLPLAAALRELLADSKLTYVVRDEALLVTTPAQAGRWMFTAVYPFDAQEFHRLSGDLGSVDPLRQIEKITASIAPGTWQSQGGRGTITLLSLGRGTALVVTQTYAVHEQIAMLLGRAPGADNLVACQ